MLPSRLDAEGDADRSHRAPQHVEFESAGDGGASAAGRRREDRVPTQSKCDDVLVLKSGCGAAVDADAYFCKVLGR